MKRSFVSQVNRKFHSNRYLQRIGLFAGFLIITTLILPRSFQRDQQYEVGKIWQETDFRAPFDFPLYKTMEEQKLQLDSALMQIIPVYYKDSIYAQVAISSIKGRLETFYAQLRAYNIARISGQTNLAKQLHDEQFKGKYNIDVTPFGDDTTQKGGTWLTNLNRSAEDVMRAIYERGYFTLRKDTFGHPFLAVQTSPGKRIIVPQDYILNHDKLNDFTRKYLSDIPIAHQNLLIQLIQEEIQPNLYYDEAETQAEMERVKKLIIPNMGKISKGTLIIKRGKTVGNREDRLLKSLALEQEKRFGKRSSLSIFIAQFLIVLLITLKLIAYLIFNRPRIYSDNRKLGLILWIMLLIIMAMVLSLKLEDLSSIPRIISFIYLAPVCIVPILVTNFFDARTGLLVNLLAALYGAALVQRGLEFAFVQIIVGTVAVYSLRRVRDRRVFFYTMAYLLIAYAVSYTAFSFFSKGSFTDIPFRNLVLFLFNISLTILAYPLIYVFERIFGITSDLTYLELLDTNHPLLQKLARKAPGSFQHSLQVANLAEALVQEVGGNPLLVHIGGLYHDIGKSLHPEYFIENTTVENSPHKKMNCEDSARLIIQHVTDGVKLAQEYKLPQEVINFIKTHHGTTRVEYFYRIHLKELGGIKCIDEEKYRYPGPLPFSKETAVLMIADSVEAATRSLTSPTEKDIINMMNHIIDAKIQSEQFSNAPLTFKDITTIREVLAKQLLSIYHGRIKYPEAIS